MTFPMTVSTKPRGLNQSEIILKYSVTFQAPAERAMVPTGTFALVHIPITIIQWEYSCTLMVPYIYRRSTQPNETKHDTTERPTDQTGCASAEYSQ